MPFLAVFSSDNSVTNPCCDWRRARVAAEAAVEAAAADSPADAEVGCHGHVLIARSVWKTRLPNDGTQSPFLPGMSWASWRV